MKQLEAIEKVSKAIKKYSGVKAIFLKGSIARDDFDEYSDVDFYCLVDDDKLEEFLNKRIDYLEQYRPLIYWSEANFVGPQIVAVYDNGLHFDLYTVTLETLQKTDQIKVLYDPCGLLSDYRQVPLAISEDDFIKVFHSFSFSLLEFEAAYCREDLLWASRLASYLSGDLAIILRYIFDKNNSRLGFKRLYKSLDSSLYNKLLKAMDLSGPSHLPKGFVLLIEIVNEILGMLADETLSKLNTEFFKFTSARINRLK